MENLLPFSKPMLEGDVKAKIKFESGGVIHLFFTWPKEWSLKGLNEKNLMRRADDLWKSTCFEAFIKPEKKNSYWEINISPSQLWNVYVFEKYRDPSPPHECKDWELLEIKGGPGEISAKIKSSFSSTPNLAVNVGLSCVLETSQGEKSYWALTHAKTKPDFHNEAGFTIKGISK